MDKLVQYHKIIVANLYNVILRLNTQEIKLPLMVEDEGKNDTISIMLGMTFLEQCKPWQITSENLNDYN